MRITISSEGAVMVAYVETSNMEQKRVHSFLAGENAGSSQEERRGNANDL